MMKRVKAVASKYQDYLPYAVWGVALAAMAGSLAMSELFHLLPCVLCWYQRILMYPLVVIVGVGVLRRDRNWVYYALPLSGLGVLVAAYHSLLQWGIIPEAIAPCQVGLSCATKQIDWLGFITIPFMSWCAFGVITGLTAVYMWVRPKARV
jgi:disulfide bond formation protein DsbB